MCDSLSNGRSKWKGTILPALLAPRMAHPPMMWMPVPFPLGPMAPAWQQGQPIGTYQGVVPWMEQAQSWSPTHTWKGYGGQGSGKGKTGATKGGGTGKGPLAKGWHKGGGKGVWGGRGVGKGEVPQTKGAKGGMGGWGGRGKGKGDSRGTGQKRGREDQDGHEGQGGERKVKFRVTFLREGLGQRFDRWEREGVEGQGAPEGPGDWEPGSACDSKDSVGNAAASTDDDVAVVREDSGRELTDLLLG